MSEASAHGMCAWSENGGGAAVSRCLHDGTLRGWTLSNCVNESSIPAQVSRLEGLYDHVRHLVLHRHFRVAWIAPLR
jgi:hypothetical protein